MSLEFFFEQKINIDIVLSLKFCIYIFVLLIQNLFIYLLLISDMAN